MHFSSLEKSGKFPDQDEITTVCINNSWYTWQQTDFLPQPPTTKLYDIKRDAPVTHASEPWRAQNEVLGPKTARGV